MSASLRFCWYSPRKNRRNCLGTDSSSKTLINLAHQGFFGQLKYKYRLFTAHRRKIVQKHLKRIASR